MQQADPGSSSSSESLGHGDRDSSLVAAIGGETSRKDGVTKSEWRECKKNLQRDPLPLLSAWGRWWGDDSLFYSQSAYRAPYAHGQGGESLYWGIILLVRKNKH